MFTSFRNGGLGREGGDGTYVPQPASRPAVLRHSRTQRVGSWAYTAVEAVARAREKSASLNFMMVRAV